LEAEEVGRDACATEADLAGVVATLLALFSVDVEAVDDVVAKGSAVGASEEAPTPGARTSATF
jgi:hypothetical protein